MMDIFFSVRLRNITGGRVFVLVGELDVSTSKGLAERLTGPPGSHVVVDLSQLTFIDSSGLGEIVTSRNRMIQKAGTLVMSRPRSIVERVLQVTGLEVCVTDWDPGRWSIKWRTSPGVHADTGPQFLNTGVN